MGKEEYPHTTGHANADPWYYTDFHSWVILLHRGCPFLLFQGEGGTFILLLQDY